MVTILKNISEVLTLKKALKKDGRNLTPSDLSIIKDGCVVYGQKEILWVGKSSHLPINHKGKEVDLSGKTLTPEIVDCHTHLVFGGDRSLEYSMRLNGANYEEIARVGGGILNTKKGTNAATKEELYQLAKKRIKQIASYGVGTIEIKSGYGLNFEKEYELSLIIAELKKEFSPQIQIKNTFMAAHAIPKEFTSSKQYLDDVVLPLLNKLAPLGIIDAVDIFHEQDYFDWQDTESLFDHAKKLKMAVKSHADEFHDNKGAVLACKYKAISTDHLLCTTDDGIYALSKSNTVATLLPGTGFFLGKIQADALKFLNAGCKVAIGSDYNPGSCHWNNVLQIAAMAAPTYKMNQAQLWASITLNAAHALGIKNQGAIVCGQKPRFTIFNADSADRITYNWGINLAEKTIY